MAGRPRFRMPARDPGRPKVPEVREMAKAYCERPGNGAGGNLHTVLDDGNLRDRDLRWSLEHARSVGDDEAARIAEAMLKMTPTQRRKV